MFCIAAFLLYLFSRKAANVSFKEGDSILNTVNRQPFVCTMGGKQQIGAENKGRKPVNILSNSFVSASVCAAHYKIGCHKVFVIHPVEDVLNSLEGFAVGGRYCGRPLLSISLMLTFLFFIIFMRCFSTSLTEEPGMILKFATIFAV